MANYTSAQLSTKELSDFDKDFPILIGNNVFEYRNLFNAKWTTSAHSSGADNTNSSYPVYNIAGRDAVSVTKTSVNATNHYVHLDPLGTITDSTCDVGYPPNPLIPTYKTISFDSSLQNHVIPGMNIEDDGLRRAIPYGAKVVSVSTGSLLMDKDAIGSSITNATLKFSGRPGANEAVFDCVIMFNHNAHRGTGGIGNSVETNIYAKQYQSEGDTDAAHICHAYTDPITDGKPYIWSDLRNDTDAAVPRRYTGVNYFTVRHKTTSSVNNIHMGLFWAGKRWQLPHMPQQPYDNKATESGVSDFSGSTGFISRHSTWGGRSVRQWTVPLHHDADIASCIEFQKDTHNFTKPFVLIENPKTNPEARLMVAETAAMVFPKTSVNERMFQITMIEKPPFYSGY